MNTLGNIRHLDTIGRFTIPIETRALMQIEPHTDLVLHVDREAGHIVMQVLHLGCVFCGGVATTHVGPRELPVCGTCCWQAAQQVEARSVRR